MSDKPLAGKKILFLAAQPPNPPDGGGAIRNLAFLTFLADAGAEIVLLCFGRGKRLDDLAMTHLSPLCRAVTLVPAPPARTTRVRLGDVLRGKADMSRRLHSPAFAAKLRELLTSQTWDAVHFQGLEVAAPYMHYATFLHMTIDEKAKTEPSHQPSEAVTQELQQRFNWVENVTTTSVQPDQQHPLVILDEFNAEYLLQQRAANTDFNALLDRSVTRGKGGRTFLRACYSWLQSSRLAKVERSAVRFADRVIVTSPTDRKAITALFQKELAVTLPQFRNKDEIRHVKGLRGLVIGLQDMGKSLVASVQKTIPDKIHLIPNGVDGDYFAPQPDVTEVGGRLIFTGTLDYRPNIDAVTWFVEAILPQIRAHHPDAEFWIVGRAPTNAVQALANLPGVVVKANVPDVRPLVAGAAVYVVPMRMGGGVRFKALEALAMGKAVVSTRLGADGLDLIGGHDLLMEDDAVAFARAVLRLLDSPAARAELGASGRESILRGYEWRSITARLLDLYGVAQQ